jgi:hypothetical protein
MMSIPKKQMILSNLPDFLVADVYATEAFDQFKDVLKPFDPGITMDPDVGYEADAEDNETDEENATNDDPNDAETQDEVGTSSEILVFDTQTQQFQGRPPSVVVCLQKIRNYSVSVTHFRVQASQPFCKTIDIQTGLGGQLQFVNGKSKSSIITDTEVSEVSEAELEEVDAVEKVTEVQEKKEAPETGN